MNQSLASSMSQSLSQSKKQKALNLLKSPNKQQKQTENIHTVNNFYTINLLIPAQYTQNEQIDLEFIRFSFKLPKQVNQITNGNESLQNIHTELIQQFFNQFELPDELIQQLYTQIQNQIEFGSEVYPKFVFSTPKQIAQKKKQIQQQINEKTDSLKQAQPFALTKQKELTQKPEPIYSFQPKITPYEFTKNEKTYRQKYIEQSDFQPKLDQNSLKLAENRKVNFVKNPELYTQFKAEKVEKINSKIEINPTFTPKITQIAQELEVTSGVVERQFLMLKESEARKEAKRAQNVISYEFSPQIIDLGVENRISIENYYLLPVKEAPVVEVENFSFQPKIDEKSRLLAEAKKLKADSEVVSEVEVKVEPEKVKRTKKEMDEFYENLYQKGVEIKEYRQILQDVAESTAVILSSSVHTLGQSQRILAGRK